MPFINLLSYVSPLFFSNLSLGLEGIGETPHVLGQVALVAEELNVGAIVLEATLGALGDVLLAAEGCEAPVLGDDDLLATGELVLRSAEGFDGGSAVGISGSDAQKNLANVDTSNETVGLAKCSTHSCLQSIGTGT